MCLLKDAIYCFVAPFTWLFLSEGSLCMFSLVVTISSREEGRRIREKGVVRIWRITQQTRATIESLDRRLPAQCAEAWGFCNGTS